MLTWDEIAAMRRMGMTMAARRLAEIQRQELEAEVFRIEIEEVAPERKILPFSR